jgi:hypothetical protein
MLWPWLGSRKKQQALDRLDWPRTCHKGHPKRPGHSACQDCTREYWARYRAASPSEKSGMSKRARSQNR